MAADKVFVERGRFGSKSIALRPKPSQGVSVATAARRNPKGPFRLFDLPPELRHQILNLCLISCDEQSQVLQIFLASRRLYAESADIFYHDIYLDLTDRTTLPGLLAGSVTPLSPRLHVRTVHLTIYPKTNLHAFNELYVPVLREMADQGSLVTVRLEISRRHPRLDFWAGDDWLDSDGDEDSFCEDEVPLLVGPETDVDYLGPAFLTVPPFQTFLVFLSEPRISKVVLHVSGADHYSFWCECHRRSSRRGLSCGGGIWPGKSTRLKVNQKRLIQLFRNARVAAQVSSPTAAAVTPRPFSVLSRNP